MKKIFVTIPWFTPAFRAGGPIQSVLNMVLALNQFYEFYIFTSNKDLPNITLQDIVTNKWTDFGKNIKVFYADEVSVKQKVSRELDAIQPDFVFINGIYSFAYTILPLLLSKQASKIISVRGMLHPEALAQKKWKKHYYLKLLKAIAVSKKVSFHATDLNEAAFVKKKFGKSTPVLVAGNFTKHLEPMPFIGKHNSILKIATVALISKMKNHLLVLKALQTLDFPVQYAIYGPIKDPIYWQKCLQEINKMPESISIKFCGEIAAEQAVGIYRQSDIYVQPSESENFGHSLWEAMACGCPIITSKSVPWVGLKEKKAGLNVEKSVQEIANAIRFFYEMEEGEFVEWKKHANHYANAISNHYSLVATYHEMFSNKN